MKMSLLVLAISGITAVGAVPDTLLDPMSRMTAVGLLGFVVLWLVARTLPTMGKDFSDTVKEIANRQHEDSTKLNDTLRDLHAHCAKESARRGDS